MIDLNNEEIEYLKGFISQSDPFYTIKQAEEDVKYQEMILGKSKDDLETAKTHLSKLQTREAFIKKLQDKLGVSDD